jgi:hypothetical protein
VNGIADVEEAIEPHQAIAVVFCREALIEFLFVLKYTLVMSLVTPMYMVLLLLATI